MTKSAPTSDPTAGANAAPASQDDSLGTLYGRAGLTLAAAAVGLYGVGATLTYDPNDPSLNVASDANPANLFGGPGAAFADVAVQTLGAGAPLAMTALFGAGVVRLARRAWIEPISKPRLLAGTAGVALVAGA